MQWTLEQHFPKPSSSSGRPDNLNYLQSVDPEVACGIYCGTQRLTPGERLNVFFRIDPLPLQPRFVLDLRFGPNKSQQTDVSASFSAYDDFGQNHRSARTPHIWQGTHGNIAPSGPMDFSR